MPRPPYTKYTDEVVALYRELLIAQIKQNHEQQLERAASLAAILGVESIPLCEMCSKPMVPRQLWNMVDTGEQHRAGYIGSGDSVLCHHHMQWQRRKQKGGMSPTTLARLRSAVGVTPPEYTK